MYLANYLLKEKKTFPPTNAVQHATLCFQILINFTQLFTTYENEEKVHSVAALY